MKIGEIEVIVLNRAVLKHEVRNIRGIFFLGLLLTILLVGSFSLGLRSEFNRMITSGIYPNTAIILRNVNSFSYICLFAYLAYVILQTYMQFRGERGQEVARFLKVLPIRSEEYFISKLLVGFLSLSLLFVLLISGILVVRQANMFWIQDYHRLSLDPALFTWLDGSLNILKILGMVYMVSLVFYSFLILIQYKISNPLVALVCACLIWLAPWFIMISLEHLTGIENPALVTSLVSWLSPIFYTMDYNYFNLYPDLANAYSYIRAYDQASLAYVANLELKYLMASVLILVNLYLAHRALKSSLIEEEDRLIAKKWDRLIFITGVSLCSGLLLVDILSLVLGLVLEPRLVWILVGLGGMIGYISSRKITRIGFK